MAPLESSYSASKEELRRMVEDIIKDYLKSAAFTDRKLTDTPTDDLMVVNRKYVNMNGTSSQRPTSSVLGQQFFDTSLGYPIYWQGTHFVKYDGTSV